MSATTEAVAPPRDIRTGDDTMHQFGLDEELEARARKAHEAVPRMSFVTMVRLVIAAFRGDKPKRVQM